MASGSRKVCVAVMRIVSIGLENGPVLAVENDEGYVLLDESGLPDSAVDLITNWERFAPVVSEIASREASISKQGASLRAPIRSAQKIICIGKNYAEHAREMGSEPPTVPVVFSKFNSAIVGPEAKVVLPEISQKVDYEAELVVVIGKQGRFIDRSKAMEHVFGYCCGNDVSARDWQKEKPGGQWLLGKTFDTFAPLGPCIVTADEIGDPHDLQISMRLNGETMQSSNTSHLIFPIDFLIAHLSQFVTLMPGDLIFTGTPEGVGAGRKPPRFLKQGDQLEVEIERIGVLANQVAGC